MSDFGSLEEMAKIRYDEYTREVDSLKLHSQLRSSFKVEKVASLMRRIKHLLIVLRFRLS